MKKGIKSILLISAVLVITETVFYLKPQVESLTTNTGSESSEIDFWQMFAGIKKERTYIEEANAYYRIPVFTPELEEQSGKEISLSGYFLPYSRLDSVIIISRFPNSSCFFCGQAGIESVAMVELGKPYDDSFRMDQMLLVRGKLSLNSSNVNKLAFVITDASIEEMGL